MNPELIDRLGRDLAAADYRAETVRALLGTEADEARQRGVFAPARRSLAERESGPLATLVRVFLFGETTDADELGTALPALGAAGALELGLLAASDADGSALRAALSLNPVRIADDSRLAAPRDWWILSDLDDQLRRRPARPYHVMGVGGATRSLIAQLPPADAERALDLGTGCGIVAMHLALCGHVVATDISERALRFARANARLNGIAGIEFRQGDLFEPVAGESFDLIASNPPFVITPRGRTADGADPDAPYPAAAPIYEYRDGGKTGDELAAAVVREAPAHLAPGGTFLCLANWETPWGGNGLERVSEWIADAGDRSGALDAWVIERDRVDPARYAETWARDGGARPGEPEFEALMRAWLDDFAARRVVAIGLGSVRIVRASEAPGTAETAVPPRSGSGRAAARGIVRTEQATGAFVPDGTLGTRLAQAFGAGVAAARMSDAQVLETRWARADEVAELREHRPGEESPRSIALVTSAPIERRVVADTLLAAAVGACDGDLTLAQLADALAIVLEVDADAVAEALVDSARELAWLGMLAPVGP